MLPKSSSHNQLLQEFYALFGDTGGDQRPGNVGASRTAVNVCQELMQIENPILFDYFKQWD